MSDLHPVSIPLLNPNEPEALLTALHAVEGQYIHPGDLLFTVETTKSAADITAEQAGYFIGLRYRPGETVRAGDVLGYLADSSDQSLPKVDIIETGTSSQPLPQDLRITQPALALARERKIDLASLPTGILVTEDIVKTALASSSSQGFAPPKSAFDPRALVIYGGGGHGKSLIDLIQACNVYKIVGVIDDGLHRANTVLGVPVLGGGELLPELYAQGCRLAVNAVGGIGNVAVRIKVFHKLAEAGFACPVLVHPSAYVESSANLSAGVQVFAHAYVGSAAHLGFGTIVNTSAIVSHDCLLGDYVNISPGAALAGAVQVGNGALIGMLVTVNLDLKIGNGARIGNGSTIKTDVPENGIVRAGAVWPDKAG